MTEESYIELNAASDRVVISLLGRFVRQSRIRQNKTQEELASEAGIARSTLSLFERGKNTSLLVFIQLLRALDMLDLLGEFREREKLSPLQLARLQHKARKKVKKTNRRTGNR